VLYRAVTELSRLTQQDNDEFSWAARQLNEILDWLPARLVALGYALSGHFEAAVVGWRGATANKESWLVPAAQVLAATGTGALDLDQEIDDSMAWDQVLQSAMGLVWRTLILWVFVIALLTLAGWAA
jgi:membrane protein required for beta-lactamase induction